MILSFTPLLILDILFSSVATSLLLRIIKKENPQIVIFDKGIKLKKKFLSWDKIKSISLHNGRISKENPFIGLKQPALQKIYILDKKGQEYSCVIDIDYYSKINRDKNNYILIRDILIEYRKISLLSDWAEKR